MGKSVSPQHSKTKHFSITIPVFLNYELEELIGTYGTSMSAVIIHIVNTWLTQNKNNVKERLAEYKEFRGLQGKQTKPRRRATTQ
jgi:hypothetical protein